MPKKDSCEIIVVLDRSGSMASIQKDMEGGFDSLIAAQRKLPGSCTVTLTQFDTVHETVYQGRPIDAVPPLELVPRGGTALLDAMGQTINSTGARFRALPEEERPERVLFVVLTDGQENASHEFTKPRILEMVKHQTQKYSWQFVYIGANQDSFAEAHSLGISIAQNFVANAAGVAHIYGVTSNSIGNYRSTGKYTP